MILENEARGTLGVRPPRNESASRAKTSGGVDAN